MKPSLTVVGGGIGGLTCAIALRKKDVPVRVLERAHEIKAIGYGIQLGPNAFHAFEKLGIEKQVLEKCSLLDEGLLRDAESGEILLRLPMGQRLKDRFGKPYAVIHRADLHQILLDECVRQDVELITDCELVDFDDKEGRVDIQTTSGPLAADALIAADGILSRIRSNLLSPPEPRKLGYAAFRAVHPMEAMPKRCEARSVTLWCGGGYHMIHYPLRGGQLFNLVAAFDYTLEDSSNPSGPLPERLLERFSGACDEVRELLGFIDLSRHWEISAFEPLATWSRGRVALLGDAAHAMLQAMAQGACQAIEDGVVLADCVAEARGDVSVAFKDYQSKRLLRATRVQYMSRFLWELIHVRKGFSFLRRDLLAKYSESDVIEQLSWLYDSDAPQRGRYEPAL